MSSPRLVRVALLLCAASVGTGCASLPVNGIGRGHAPRVQAAIILVGAALETLIAVSEATMAQQGETVCRPKSNAGDGALSAKNDCTTPLEYAVSAGLFGFSASIDTGVAIYQLVTGKQAFERPRPRTVDETTP